MAKEQKGFIIYGDTETVVDRLTDEEAGQLLKGMVKYFNSGEVPDFSGVLEFVFIPIKQQMDRDAEKFAEKCEKNRNNIRSYWDKVKGDTDEYDRIRPNTMATNTKTNTDTNTKTNTKTDTNTKTNTKTDTNTKTNTKTDTTTTTDTNGGGGSDPDADSFDLWKKLDSDGIDRIFAAYPESGSYLIDEVASEVRTKRRRVKNAVNYVLGYAKKVGWDDNADHFVAPWEVWK